MSLISADQCQIIMNQMMSLSEEYEFVFPHNPDTHEAKVFAEFVETEWEDARQQLTENYKGRNHRIHCITRALWVSVSYAKKVKLFEANALREDIFKYIDRNFQSWKPNSLTAHERKHRGHRDGHQYESPAIQLYEEQYPDWKVVRVKRLVHPRIPFMVVAPDGIAFDAHGNFRVIEIKSDDNSSLGHFYNNGNGLVEINDGSFRVQKHTDGYLQMQLTMLIMNLKSMDLVLYLTKSQQIVTIHVYRDENVISDNLSIIKRKYIDVILPTVIDALDDY